MVYGACLENKRGLIALRGFESYYFLQMRKRYVDTLFIREIKRLSSLISYLINQPNSDTALLKAMNDFSDKLEEYSDYKNG